MAIVEPPKTDHFCRGCGKTITNESTHCAGCAVEAATKRLISVASLGAGSCPQPGSSCQAWGETAKTCKGMHGMGCIDAASLDYQGGIHRENSTPARANVNLRYCIADWSVALVRRPYPPRLPAASEALEGAGGTGAGFVSPVKSEG
jgi:hypothetical protein